MMARAMIGIVHGVGLTLLAKKFVQGSRIGLRRQCGSVAAGQFDDARPALRRAHHAADAGAAGSVEQLRHGLVGRDHEVFDQVCGAIVLGGPESRVPGRRRRPDRPRRGGSRARPAGCGLRGCACAASSCRRSCACSSGEAATFASGSGSAFEPRADLAVCQLGAVVDQGAIDGLLLQCACASTTNSVTIAARSSPSFSEVRSGGELVGQHGEIAGCGVDGFGLSRGVLVDGRVLCDGRGDVCHADAHTDAGGRRARPTRSGRDPARCRCRWKTRGGCVDRAHSLPLLELRHCGYCELLLDAGWKVGMKTLAHHLGERRCGQIESRSGHGSVRLPRCWPHGGRAFGASAVVRCLWSLTFGLVGDLL